MMLTPLTYLRVGRNSPKPCFLAHRREAMQTVGSSQPCRAGLDNSALLSENSFLDPCLFDDRDLKKTKT